MNNKPKVLELVENQTHKTYGNREAGKSGIIDHSKDPLPPIFVYMGICLACGKEKHVNAFTFCEDCWITYSHLRSGKPKYEKTPNGKYQ